PAPLRTEQRIRRTPPPDRRGSFAVWTAERRSEGIKSPAVRGAQPGFWQETTEVSLSRFPGPVVLNEFLDGAHAGDLLGLAVGLPGQSWGLPHPVPGGQVGGLLRHYFPVGDARLLEESLRLAAVGAGAGGEQEQVLHGLCLGVL